MAYEYVAVAGPYGTWGRQFGASPRLLIHVEPYISARALYICTVPLEKFGDKYQNTPRVPLFSTLEQGHFA